MKADNLEKNNKTGLELTGKVIQKKFAAGSKSESDAVFLKTEEGTYKLRRVKGNAFHSGLENLVGKKIKATAVNIINNDLFFLDDNSIKVLDDE